MATNPVLQQGASGDYVKQLQEYLTGSGYEMKAGVDGKFGSQTYNAVKQFQGANGLTIDGSVGPQTWGYINSNPLQQQPVSTTTPQPTQNPASTYQDPLAEYSLPDMPQYQNPYQEMLEQLLGQVNNQQQFQYDPTQDQSYQAYVQQQQYLGDRAGQNALANAAAASGGRVSSWAQSANAQTQQQYAQQASQAMGQFEQMAYGRHQDGINNLYQKANFIMGLDDQSYGRYVDQFNYQVEQVKFQYQSKLDSLQNRRAEMATAWERVKELGYVDNQSAATLGVKVGTPSSIVQAEMREQQRRLEMMEIELKQQKEMIDYQTKKEKELIAYRASRSGSGGGSSNSTNISDSSNSPMAVQGWDDFMDSYRKGQGEEWLKKHGSDLKSLSTSIYNNAVRMAGYGTTGGR